jgi:hypothetical protein
MRHLAVGISFIVMAVVGSAFAGILHTPAHAKRPATSWTEASWVFKAQTLESMVAYSDVIVRARFQGSQAGRTVRGENDLPPLLFELNDFVIDEVLKSTPSLSPTLQSGHLTVERLRSLQAERPVLATHDGGPFEADRRYILMLTKQPIAPFAYILVNDEARPEIALDGTLVPSGTGKVADALGGFTLESLRRAAGMR